MCPVIVQLLGAALRMTQLISGFGSKTKILILLAIPFIFYACNKDTYTTKPQISIKSISSTLLKQGDILLFTIGFTDAEGDIQDTLWVQKISRTCPQTPGAQFISRNRVPNFTPTPQLKGTLEIGYANNWTITGHICIISIPYF